MRGSHKSQGGPKKSVYFFLGVLGGGRQEIQDILGEKNLGRSRGLSLNEKENFAGWTD